MAETRKTDRSDGPTAADRTTGDNAPGQGPSPRRTVSGPGAADFLASAGAEDSPESEFFAQGKQDGPLSDARRLIPELEPSDTDPLSGAIPRDPKAKKPDL